MRGLFTIAGKLCPRQLSEAKRQDHRRHALVLACRLLVLKQHAVMSLPPCVGQQSLIPTSGLWLSGRTFGAIGHSLGELKECQPDIRHCIQFHQCRWLGLCGTCSPCRTWMRSMTRVRSSGSIGWSAGSSPRGCTRPS